jgi:hypothetical protein
MKVSSQKSDEVSGSKGGALKVIDLKLLCLSQLCGLKDREIKVAF